jgi:hypothetical protein
MPLNIYCGIALFDKQGRSVNTYGHDKKMISGTSIVYLDVMNIVSIGLAYVKCFFTGHSV